MPSSATCKPQLHAKQLNQIRKIVVLAAAIFFRGANRTVISRIKARMLLAECRGDEIWAPQTCRQKGVPEVWIEELADTFESGFRSDRETIYEQGEVTNQYHGVRDLALAHKLAEFLGVDAERATEFSLGREAEVRALQEAVDEL